MSTFLRYFCFEKGWWTGESYVVEVSLGGCGSNVEENRTVRAILYLSLMAVYYACRWRSDGG